MRFAYLEDGPADGALALLMHGFPDDAHTWRHLVDPLVAAGFRVVRPWSRGYGTSTAPDVWATDPSDLGADLNALHAALGADERAVLIGHDWGAFAAWRAAASDPSRWCRLITIGVPPDVVTADVLTSPSQLARLWYQVVFQTPGAERLVRARDWAMLRTLWRRWSPGMDVADVDAEVDRIAAMFSDPASLRAALSYYRGVVPEAIARRPPSAVPDVPTLYLHGADDGCFSASWAERTRAVLGDASRVAVIADAGHFLHLEQPVLVSQLVTDFLT